MSDPAPLGGDVYIADTSAWRWAAYLPEERRQEWHQAVANNQIATVPPVLLELLYRSRKNVKHFEGYRESIEALSRNILPDSRIWKLVVEIYAELAKLKQLEGTSLTDILIAATATEKNLPVLHYDKDFERLAKLDCLDFRAVRIAPKGSLSSNGQPSGA